MQGQWRAGREAPQPASPRARSSHRKSPGLRANRRRSKPIPRGVSTRHASALSQNLSSAEHDRPGPRSLIRISVTALEHVAKPRRRGACSLETITTQTVHGACHHDCPDSCGWTVTVDHSTSAPVAVKLRGNPNHPFSRGELCPKVNRFLDRVYSPDRILHPLRRTGPKGSGDFEPISWTEALTEIALRLHEVIDTHGGEALLPYSDAGNQSLLSMFGAGNRFFNHLGATQLERAICGVTVGA
ncbi:MAG: molybdopterin-dependent oxidoreductase, partial [Ilumatobacter sp.]|nr:molybdopterin-dependent oxidoreductase [Ilumatobacter sp.]